jgi:glycosyltransferase involved in cell wall biosynthesis
MTSSPESRLRIGFVLHVMQVAGAEVLVAETIRRLRDLIEPVVLCLDGVGQLGEQMQREGVAVVALGRKPGLDFAVARSIAREVASRNLKLLHAHQYTPFFYTALAKLAGSPRFHLMFTEHGRHYPDVVSWKRRLGNRLVLSHLADEINGVCGFSVRSLAGVDGFTRQMEVIENGIDPGRYQAPVDLAALRRELGLDPGRQYVACVARFHWVKDHRMLLEAFALVAARVPTADLLLIGDGDLRPEIEARVSEPDLAGRVRLLGVRMDVPRWLAASDVFALSSISEAASITLMEAMASGLPSVVTDVGGNPDIVRREVDGLLTPRGDAPAFAAALERVLTDPALGRQFGVSSRQRALERYSLDRTVATYFDRYERAVSRLRGR